MADYTLVWRPLTPREARKYNLGDYQRVQGTHAWLHSSEGRQGSRFLVLWMIDNGGACKLGMSESLKSPITWTHEFPSRYETGRFAQTACFDGTLLEAANSKLTPAP